jgi:hypothetical protein
MLVRHEPVPEGPIKRQPWQKGLFYLPIPDLPLCGRGQGEMGVGLIRAAVDLDTVPAAIDDVQIASRVELHRRRMTKKRGI